MGNDPLRTYGQTQGKHGQGATRLGIFPKCRRNPVKNLWRGTICLFELKIMDKSNEKFKEVNDLLDVIFKRIESLNEAKRNIERNRNAMFKLNPNLNFEKSIQSLRNLCYEIDQKLFKVKYSHDEYLWEKEREANMMERHD